MNVLLQSRQVARDPSMAMSRCRHFLQWAHRRPELLERSVARCQEFHHVGHLEFRSEVERLAVFSNSFDSGMPWREAIRLYLTNVTIKMKNRSSCCGNLGQPGC